MNILILGSNFSLIHKKLYELNHRLFIIPDPNRKLPDSNLHLYASLLNVQNEKEVEEIAKKICIDKDLFNIDQVIAFNEKWQLVASRVASSTGLPINIDPQLVSRTLDKYQMREHLQKAGLSTVKFIKVIGYAQLLEAIKKVGYPAILKPLKGEASRSITLLSHEQDLINLTKKDENYLSEEFILESFLRGEEYSVEAVSYNDKHSILAITKKFKNDNFVEIGHVLPAPISTDLGKRIEDYVIKFLNIMKFNNTASHTEIIISNGMPVVIESHTRPGGDNIYRLLNLSTGIDLMDLVAKISTRCLDSVDLVKKKNDIYSAIWYHCLEGKEGLVIDNVIGIDEANSTEYIEEVSLLVESGDIVRPVKNSFDRAAYAIATSSSADRSIYEARNSLEKLDFHYKHNNLEDNING